MSTGSGFPRQGILAAKTALIHAWAVANRPFLPKPLHQQRNFQFDDEIYDASIMQRFRRCRAPLPGLSPSELGEPTSQS
jgi:hypothetical protein